MSFVYEMMARQINKIFKERGYVSFYSKLRSEGLIDLLKQYAENQNYENAVIRRTQVPLHDMQALSNAFFKNIDKIFGTDFFETLKESFLSGKVKVYGCQPSEKGGKNNVFHGSVDKMVMRLNPRSDMRGYLAVAHESGHVLEESLKKSYGHEVDCLREITTMFIERLFIHFLSKIKIVNSENPFISETEKKYLFAYRKNLFLRQVKSLIYENEVVEMLGDEITPKSLRNFEKECAKTERGRFLAGNIFTLLFNEDSEEFAGPRQFRYVLGEIVAGALFEDFLRKPKETMVKFEEYLKSDRNLTKQQTFEMLLGENYAQKMQNMLITNEKTKI